MISSRTSQSLQAKSILLINTSTSSIKAIVFKSSILKIASVILHKTSQVEKFIIKINRISFRLLLIQSYFKYNFSILTKKYSLFLSVKTVDQ